MTAVVRKCHRIQHQLLKQYDPALYQHLSGLGIEPQLYGMYVARTALPGGIAVRCASPCATTPLMRRAGCSRWLRLLFAREFHVDDVLKLWDGIFADDPYLGVVDYLSVSMLLFIRDARTGCLGRL